MADITYERILCIKNEVFVFKIPPRQSNRGYRAADWKLDNPDWTGRLKVVCIGKDLNIKLEDKNSGELFAQCPVDEYPGIAVESVLDSSRYFVIRIKDGGGRSAFIGIGFTDRADSFDLNVTLSDHFKSLKQDEEAENSSQELNNTPKLDLGFKEGQTITINIGNKKSDSSKPRPRSQAAGTIGLLPPPPGVKLTPHHGRGSPSHKLMSQTEAVRINPRSSSGNSNVDLLCDLGTTTTGTSSNQSAFQSSHITSPALTQPSLDPWGDFISSNSNTTTSVDLSSNSSNEPWIQF